MNGDDDRRAFAAAMRGVRPLERKTRIAPERRTLGNERPRSAAARHAAAQRAASRRAAVTPQTLRDLNRGRLAIDAEIDLHGLTAAAARRVLENFVATAVDEHLRCVRIIHGRGNRSGPGGPVLKELVHRWLDSRDDVLAFAPALPRDGGSGAVYVLLRPG
jgi:DNA-nicking Smr family endonuclease